MSNLTGHDESVCSLRVFACTTALIAIVATVFAGCSSHRVASHIPARVRHAADTAVLKAHNCKGEPSIRSGDGHFIVDDLSLRELIAEAYDLSFGQSYVLVTQPSAKLFGVSDWSGTSINNSQCYDIDAVVDVNSTLQQNLSILQPLLADRFKLKMHRTRQNVPVYILVLANPGLTGRQLKKHLDSAVCDNPRASLPLPPGPYPRSPLPCRSGPYIQGNHLFALDISMDTLARFLTGYMLNQMVINETSLTGTFDLDVTPTSASKQAFIDALDAQLGLKLEPATRMTDLFVIDNVQVPSPN